MVMDFNILVTGAITSFMKYSLLELVRSVRTRAVCVLYNSEFRKIGSHYKDIILIVRGLKLLLTFLLLQRDLITKKKLMMRK